jgi:hypothetical protein
MHARAEAGEPVASLLVTARISAPAEESSRGSVAQTGSGQSRPELYPSV